ncbi:hypothetical protein O1611_g9934 [Lasiodiplodia mahajangana]|uniref:Uncharacterized protein n=1 Tax=Lasiodiplodia mahajangana TaxID=1108764 RepID=A0ACC2J3K4_9PEZI|nr:hypothetical protein O1611_g9934 [Lasiodiplodia mahajangana]
MSCSTMLWSSRLLLLFLSHSQLWQICLAASAAVHDGLWQPEYALYATEEDITVNCEHRRSVVINGTYPGPTLYFKEGQTTWVRVYNHLPDTNFTVHWHGLTMRTAPFSDGSPQVSQWPIAPGEFFDYEIRPEIGDAGTYFYHSHVGFQSMTAHGVIYIEDAGTPPYKWDEDVPVVLGDFYHKCDEEIESDLLATPFVWPGEPDSLVFNDRSGTRSFDDAPDDSCKPYIITVEPGKTYRFRFIGAATISYIQAGIEGHSNLTVISADGYYTKPVQVDHIQLGGGQRFDVLITAKSEEELAAEGKDQYWIRYETRGRSPSLEGYALLQYSHSSSSTLTKRCNKNSGKPRSSQGDGPNISRKGGSPRWQPKPPGKNPDHSPVSLPPDGSLTGWLEYSLEALHPQVPFPRLSEVTRTVYITVEEKVINGTYVGGSVTGSLIWV